MAALDTLGARSLGVWTRRQALAVVSRHVVDRRLRTGTWQVVLPGIYADGGYVLDAEQRAVAAVLASGASVPGPAHWLLSARGDLVLQVPALACGRTAARLWGLPLIDDDDPVTGAAEHLLDHVHTQTPRTVRSGAAGAGALVRHRLRLGSGDAVRRPCGLWVTTPLRTAVDCVALLTREALVCLLDDGLHRHLFTAPELTHAASGRAGLAGSRAFAAAVASADGRAESPAETLARLLLLPVLPRLVPQVRLLDARGRVVARFDLADEVARRAVELDGRRGHAGDRMVARDRRRDGRTELLGWRTERGGWIDVRRRPEEFVQRVLAFYARAA